MTSRFSPADVARLLGLPEPTPEQATVIAAPAQPMAVIAGAGSGKSETMAARLVWLVANGLVRPDRVLGLTFTRKAAAELADRVRARLDRLRRSGLAGDQQTDGDPVISTYHAYAGRLVGDHALREGLEPSMRLITPAESWQLAARIVAAYDGPMGDIGWGPPTVTAAVLALAAELSEHLREPADVRAVGEWLEARRAALGGKLPAYVRKMRDSQRAREQLLPLAARYATAKAAREVLDHGDQMALAARIASRHPQVGLAERGRYQVVLLDEYQDTSHAQLVLLRALFGGGHPVTAVGDPCQSIYGWRGASAGNLRRFAQDFPVLPRPPRPGAAGHPAPVRLLSTSFRNAGRVLDTAAVLQEQLRAEAPDVPRLVPAPDRAGRGKVACALLDTIAGEATWAAAQIAGLLALPPGTAPDGAPWPDGSRAPVRPSDIAVLCRKRSQFPALRRALEARGIPVEVVGLGGLLDGARGTGRGGDAPGAERCGRLRRARPAAHRAALADRPAGPGGAGPPRPIARQVGPRPVGHRGRAIASQPQDALAEALTDLTTEAGSLVEALDDLGQPGRLLRGRRHPVPRAGRRAPHAARPAQPPAPGPDRRGGTDARPGHRDRVPAGRRSARRPRRPGRAHRRRGRVRRVAGGAHPRGLPGLPGRRGDRRVWPGGRPRGRDGLGEAGHRAHIQGPAVGRRPRPRAGRGGAVTGLPGPAPAVHPVDGQPAAAAVRPAR